MKNTNILSEDLRAEIKNLIHEVLDDRGYKNLRTYYKYSDSLDEEI